jgi:putative nucleotidyltransferase with HDIG domain
VAGRLAQDLGEDANTLVSAAWLHDVGYAGAVAQVDFHPLDGASFLRRQGFPDRVVDLVAFHSGAEFEARELGLEAQLAAFADERTLVRDLLWYADMTVGPDGQRLTFSARMEDVRERYPPDHYIARALEVGMRERELAVIRAEAWISDLGLSHV